MAELIYIPINSAEESPFLYIHTIHRALFTLKKGTKRHKTTNYMECKYQTWKKVQPYQYSKKYN